MCSGWVLTGLLRRRTRCAAPPALASCGAGDECDHYGLLLICSHNLRAPWCDHAFASWCETSDACAARLRCSLASFQQTCWPVQIRAAEQHVTLDGWRRDDPGRFLGPFHASAGSMQSQQITLPFVFSLSIMVVACVAESLLYRQCTGMRSHHCVLRRVRLPLQRPLAWALRASICLALAWHACRMQSTS
jgi:hypothetical protein